MDADPSHPSLTSTLLLFLNPLFHPFPPLHVFSSPTSRPRAISAPVPTMHCRNNSQLQSLEGTKYPIIPMISTVGGDAPHGSRRVLAYLWLQRGRCWLRTAAGAKTRCVQLVASADGEVFDAQCLFPASLEEGEFPFPKHTISPKWLRNCVL